MYDLQLKQTLNEITAAGFKIILWYWQERDWQKPRKTPVMIASPWSENRYGVSWKGTFNCNASSIKSPPFTLKFCWELILSSPEYTLHLVVPVVENTGATEN